MTNVVKPTLTLRLSGSAKGAKFLKTKPVDVWALLAVPLAAGELQPSLATVAFLDEASVWVHTGALGWLKMAGHLCWTYNAMYREHLSVLIWFMQIVRSRNNQRKLPKTNRNITQPMIYHI